MRRLRRIVRQTRGVLCSDGACFSSSVHRSALWSSSRVRPRRRGLSGRRQPRGAPFAPAGSMSFVCRGGATGSSSGTLRFVTVFGFAAPPLISRRGPRSQAPSNGAFAFLAAHIGSVVGAAPENHFGCRSSAVRRRRRRCSRFRSFRQRSPQTKARGCRLWSSPHTTHARIRTGCSAAVFSTTLGVVLSKVFRMLAAPLSRSFGSTGSAPAVQAAPGFLPPAKGLEREELPA
jgi:hypothetical protein